MRGRVLAVVFGSSALGIVLGVPGGTWLGQQAGWRVAFLALSGLCLLALVMTAVLMPTARPEQGHAASGTTPDARRYSLLVVTTALLVTGVFTAYTYISPFLTEVSGFPSRAVSPLLLVFGVAGIVGTIAAGALIDRSPRAAMISAVALQATALLGLYLVGTVAPVVIGLVALSGLSMSALAATLQSRILDVAPGSSDVASAGVGTAFNVGIGGGAFVGGLLLPGFGVRSTPLVGGLLAVAALGVVLAEPLVASSGGRRAHARPPTR